MPTRNQPSQLNKTGWINRWSLVYRVGLKPLRFLRLREGCPGPVLLVIRLMILE
jgi:hypothetical protein